MRLRNLDLRRYQRFLDQFGCVHIRDNGGHRVYEYRNPKTGVAHPIILQTHVDPVPERIVKQHLQYFGLSRAQFAERWRQL